MGLDLEFAAARFDPVYGARPLKRANQQAVENPLSKKILSGEFVPGEVTLVDVSGAELAFRKSDKRAG